MGLPVASDFVLSAQGQVALRWAQVHNMAAESRKEQRIDALKFQTAGDQSSSGLRGAPSSRPKTKNQLLEGYHNQLREYRALQVNVAVLRKG